MEFTIMETLRASTVEMWLHAVKQRFLDAAPIKCVGLDCEFTTLAINLISVLLSFNSRWRPRFWSSKYVGPIINRSCSRISWGTPPLDSAVRLSAMTCACCNHTEFKFRWCMTDGGTVMMKPENLIAFDGARNL
jgi:hypothetical protein